MMNEEQIFMQTVRCDCGKDLFKISEMYKENIVIRCDGCGARFTIFAEKGGEAVIRTLARGQDQKKLSALLTVRLRAFEEQAGTCREAAALLFQEYIESLYPAVLEGIDNAILQHLQTLFFSNQDKSISDASALLLKIEEAAVETLERNGYELQVDGETED